MSDLNEGYVDAGLFAAYTIASVTGLMLLKLHISSAKSLLFRMDWFGAPVIMSVAGAILYVGSFVVWLVILERSELSVAYPIAIGLTLVCSVLAAVVVLGEVLTYWRMFGILMVFVGIVTITRS